MSSPFVGEIRMFGGNFAPAGWAMCDGQLMAIAQNDTLFTLIGTTYGGNGTTTFGLPDLQGRVPVHQSNSFVMGQKAGTENVSLTQAELPPHTHALQGAIGNTVTDPTNGVLTSAIRMFVAAPATPVAMGPTGFSGSSLPHENMQPFLVVTFILSLFGIFPSQN